MNDLVSRIAVENVAGERGHPMTTFKGIEFWPMDPRPEDMDIRDVAHHLAMQCRFNGAIREFYSVAEHCWLGSHLIKWIALRDGYTNTEARNLAFEFLMHDAAEAWIGDMIRPIKNGSICGAEFKGVEARVEAAVKIKWNLLLITPPLVKRIDNEMCVIEQRFRYHNLPACLTPETELHPEVTLNFWGWEKARFKFLQRYCELTGRVVDL